MKGPGLSTVIGDGASPIAVIAADMIAADILLPLPYSRGDFLGGGIPNARMFSAACQRLQVQLGCGEES